MLVLQYLFEVTMPHIFQHSYRLINQGTYYAANSPCIVLISL